MSSRPHRIALAVATLLLLAVAPAAFAGGADTVTVVARQVDVNPGETNPCTGATGTIVDDEQDVFHITALADGTLNLTGHSTVSVTLRLPRARNVRVHRDNDESDLRHHVDEPRTSEGDRRHIRQRSRSHALDREPERHHGRVGQTHVRLLVVSTALDGIAFDV